MKALWFVCFLAVALVAVSCDNKHEAVKETESGGDADTMIDEEPADDADIPVTGDTDISVPANVNGEQQWYGVLPTGQKKCYDLEKEIVCPEPGEHFFGQDAQFNDWKTRSYTQPVTGVAFDEVTRLFWQKSFASSVTWQQAQSYCNGLVLSDKAWRLPTPHELKSLINYGLILDGKPAHPATTFPCNLDGGGAIIPAGCTIDTPNDWFWASARTHDPLTAWVVYFYDGYLEYTARDNLYSVRCVASN